MNRVYNLVWNHKRRIVQVASELARSTGKRSGNRPARRLSRRGLATACAAIWVLGGAGLLLSGTAVAGTYTVTKTVDDGSNGTLSWAIDQANADVASTIAFDLVDGATIAAGSGRPEIDQAVIFDNAHELTIEGDLSSTAVIAKQGEGELQFDGLDSSESLIIFAGDLTLGNESSQTKVGRITLEAGTRLTNQAGNEITGQDGSETFSGEGKYGVDSSGPEVVNSGAIFGGAGADGTSSGGDGRHGGAGVHSQTDGDFTLSNAGMIVGGAGGGSDTDDGGDGGYGVYGDNDGDFTLSNSGTIRGGAGGAGDGDPGNGGAGVYAANSGMFELTNDGLIAGGAIGTADVDGKYSAGAGVERSDGDLTLNNTGTIRGGAGNDEGNRGGAGVDMDAGQLTLNNAGTIEGVDGGAGIYSVNSDLELTNTGTIQGGAGIYFINGNNAVEFSLINKGTIRSNDDGNGVSITSLSGDFILDNQGDIQGGAGHQGDYGGEGINFLIGGENDFSLTNAGTIRGGAGGQASGGGDGGTGGVAVSGEADLFGGGSGEFSFTNQGKLLGGTGGAGGDGYYDGNGAHGNAGGAGLAMIASGARVTNAGLIAGGRADGGAGKRAPAIMLRGEDNTLTLEQGYAFKGNVISGLPDSGTGAAVIALAGDNTLVLGGDADAVFNVSNIASADEIEADKIEAAGDFTRYYGFTKYKKTGSSSWILTGTTLDDSPWTVTQGRLIGGTGSGGQAELGGDVEVKAGAVLGGNLIVHGALSGKGTLSPGHSVGTMSFGKDDDFAGDYHAEVNAAGAADLVTIETGGFDLSGIGLYVSGENGSGGARLDYSYTIIRAPGGISGEFKNGGELKGGIAHSLLQLDPLIYGDDGVRIRFSIDEDKAKDLTDNQSAVLDHMGDNPAALAAVASPGYQNALDSLSGEYYASAATALLGNSRYARTAVSDRLARHCAGDQRREGVVTDSRDRACGGQVWLQAYGNWNQFDGDGNAAALDSDVGGFFLGADKQIASGVRLGFVAGYGHASNHVDARRSSGSDDSYRLGLYGSYNRGPFALKAGVIHAWHDLDSTRHIRFQGFADDVTAEYDARATQAFAELGYQFRFGETAIEPFVRGAYVHLKTDGFTEQGGTAALDAESSTNDLTTTLTGLRLSHAFDVGSDTTIHAKGMLGWRHNYGDTSADTELAFPGSDTFSVAGVPLAEDALAVKAGLGVDVGDNLTLDASYVGQFGSGVESNGVTAGLVWQF